MKTRAPRRTTHARTEQVFLRLFVWTHSLSLFAALGQEDLNLPTFVKIGEPTDEDSARLSSDIHQRSTAFGEQQDRENHGIINHPDPPPCN